jgi:regulatory factor X
MRRIHQDFSGPNMVRRQLKFPTQQEPPYAHNEPIELPSLTGYLPDGTDLDVSGALIALYRTHCISVIDCFRFCKERMFWHHFTSFHGTLTAPVQKLLAHPKVAAWIQECDWLMYQKMIRFVSPLALQVMPTKVIDTFKSISVKLVHHISNTFQIHPHHVRDAKMGPASIFAALIDRLLRVNATAHAAANMLTNDANRDQMWHDWICFVRPTGVVESTLPCCGYSRTLRILLLEVGELLGPLRSITYQGIQQVFANAQADPGPSYKPLVYNEVNDSSTSGVLDRWTAFLYDLPSRFPEVDARQLIWIVGEVSSACIRDITMAQALSFGSWWVTKVWVDEMLRWIAEKGGFLESGPSSTNMRPKKRTATAADLDNDADAKVHGGSRPRTGVSEANDGPGHPGSIDISHSFQPDHNHMESHLQTDTYRQVSATNIGGPSLVNGANDQPVSSEPHQQIVKDIEVDHGQNPDDSGIGMDLELPQTTPIRLADYGGFVAGSVNGGSDPADVIVC